MAKTWAVKFYKSAAWKQARELALMRTGYVCELCDAPATEVHHSPELTPLTIDNPDYTLNQKRLHPLCHNCHTRIQDYGSACMFDDNGQLIGIVEM